MNKISPVTTSKHKYNVFIVLPKGAEYWSFEEMLRIGRYFKTREEAESALKDCDEGVLELVSTIKLHYSTDCIDTSKDERRTMIQAYNYRNRLCPLKME